MRSNEKPVIGSINWVFIRRNRIEWVNHTRLLGITIDDRLSWSQHLADVKKSFVNKLNLIKKSSFLGREALLDLYCKVVLPAVLYGLMIVWVGCANAEQLNSLESLHHRAARMIFNLTYDMPSADVYQYSNWSTLSHMYKLRVINLFYKVFSDDALHALCYLVNKSSAAYDLRRSNRVTVARFNSYSLKNSASHRGAILWNAVCTYYTVAAANLRLFIVK